MIWHSVLVPGSGASDGIRGRTESEQHYVDGLLDCDKSNIHNEVRAEHRCPHRLPFGAFCCPVTGHNSDEMMTLASKGIFVPRYPEHVMTVELKRVVAQWVAS